MLCFSESDILAMMRSFEPKMETKWPFSAAPVGIHPFQNSRFFDSVLMMYNIGAGFFSNNENNFQPVTLSRPTASSSASTLTPFPAQVGTGDQQMTLKESSKITASLQKFRGIRHKSLRESGMKQTKRQKIISCPSSSSDEAAVSPTLMTKTSARKSQKIGDRVTALQRLVSPYGKTDMASVLHEASICIKALHEQIQNLTSPYLGRDKQDLRDRGLCLFPVTPTLLYLTK